MMIRSEKYYILTIMGRSKGAFLIKFHLDSAYVASVCHRLPLMNKLRLYINLLIVIQIGFLNRRLEVMRLVSAFVPVKF